MAGDLRRQIVAGSLPSHDPAMKAGRFGRIVNISSGAGLGISLTGIQPLGAA